MLCLFKNPINLVYIIFSKNFEKTDKIGDCEHSEELGCAVLGYDTV